MGKLSVVPQHWAGRRPVSDRIADDRSGRLVLRALGGSWTGSDSAVWTCKICDAEVDDDTWTQCWKCAHDRHVKPAEVKEIRARFEARVARFPQCLRCQARVDSVGTRMIRDESGRGLFSRNMFVDSDTYDVYVCPNGGRVEFYMDGNRRCAERLPAPDAKQRPTDIFRWKPGDLRRSRDKA